MIGNVTNTSTKGKANSKKRKAGSGAVITTEEIDANVKARERRKLSGYKSVLPKGYSTDTSFNKKGQASNYTVTMSNIGGPHENKMLSENRRSEKQFYKAGLDKAI